MYAVNNLNIDLCRITTIAQILKFVNEINRQPRKIEKIGILPLTYLDIYDIMLYCIKMHPYPLKYGRYGKK